MNKEHQIVALRLAGLLADFYGYDIMKLDPATGDISLGAPLHPRFPGIDIRLSPLEASQDKSKEMVETINELNREKRDIKLLTLSFVDQTVETDTHLIVNLNQSNQFHPEVLSTFPKLAVLKWEIQNDARDIKKAVDDLNKATLKHQTQRRRKMSVHNSKGALSLIAICILVYLFGLYINSLAQYETTYMIFLGGIYVPFIQAAFEVHRFLTAGFIHADLMHLFMNMLSLYNVSTLLEKVYGTKTFVLTTLASIIGGNLTVYIADQKAAISVGMSTGIYGLLGLFVVYLVDTGLIKTPVFKQNLFTILAINLMINFMPNISWLGHLGGFVTGVIIGILLIKKPDFQSFKKNMMIASLILVLAMSYLAINRKKPQQFYFLSDQDTIQVARRLKLDFYADYLQDRLFQYYAEELKP